jgi:cobyrinic acid a,c-diamide synthase
VAVVEGVMGLYDGASAQVARKLDLPVVLVVDVWAMGASAGALIRGFRPDAVILNRVASPAHFDLCRRSTTVPVLGSVPMDRRFGLPERHLGLALEARGRLPRIDLRVDLDRLLRLGRRRGTPPRPPRIPAREVRLAVARDDAFAFYYPENLDLLEEAGARLLFFSPLRGEMPEADALYLGGGFPELVRCPKNRRLQAAVRAGMPTVAECGGLMYLVGQGLVPGRVEMTDRLQHFGYAEAVALRDTVLVRRGQRLRGHEYHHSRWIHPGVPAAYRLGSRREGYAAGSIHASYVHLHFGGAPTCAGRFLANAKQWKGSNR